MSSRAGTIGIGLVCGLVLCAIYASSVPDSFNTVRSHGRFFDSDGEFILRQFREEKTFTHNDHLFYHVAARGIHAASGDPLFSHLVLSVLSGVLGILVLSGAGYRLTHDAALALLASALVAGSAGWWFFSSTIDTYLPSLAASCLALALALMALRAPSPALFAGLGAAMGIAFLLRTDGFLLLVLGLVFAAPRCRSGKYLLVTGAAGFAVGAVGYAVLAAVFYDVAPGDVATFALRGIDRPDEVRAESEWGSWKNVTASRTALTLVNHAFYTVLLPSIESTRELRFWRAYSAPGLLALGLFVAAELCALIALLERAASAQSDRVEWRIVAALCLSWGATRVLFYTWWDPFDPFLFAVMSLPALWMVVLFGSQAILECLPMAWQRRALLGIWALVCAVVWLHNVRTLIAPLRALSP